MKDYDEGLSELEGVVHTFSLRGYEFRAMPVMPAKHLSALADVQTGVAPGRTYEITTEAIRAQLEPAYREQWDRVLEMEHKVPISLRVLMQIADDLVSEVTARPPTSPTPSGSMGASTTTPSTDGSASTAAPVSTP